MKQSNDFCFDLFCVRTALKKATTDLSLLALASPYVTCYNNPKTISLLLLHASTTLIRLRASRSLAKTDFFGWVLEGFFAFFLCLISTSFLIGFLLDLEGFGETKMRALA